MRLRLLTLPEFVPTRAQLWYRQRLALAVLNQQEPSAATTALVVRILHGTTIDTLVEESCQSR